MGSSVDWRRRTCRKWRCTRRLKVRAVLLTALGALFAAMPAEVEAVAAVVEV